MSSSKIIAEYQKAFIFYTECRLYGDVSLKKDTNSPTSDLEETLRIADDETLSGDAKRVILSTRTGDLYRLSIGILYGRFLRVLTDYMNTVGLAKKLKIPVTDRNNQILFPSVSSTIKHAQKILRKSYAETTEDSANFLEWRTVRESGSLVMKEISYLSGRIDQLNNAYATGRSILIAIIGLGASLILGVAGLLQNHLASLDEEEPNKALEEVSLENQQLRDSVHDLENAVEKIKAENTRLEKLISDPE